MEYTEIIKNNKAAIIMLRVSKPAGEGKRQISIRGTGFVISEDGSFITNAHVYNEIPESDRVYLDAWITDREEDGLIFYESKKVEVIRFDQENDIVLMKVIGKPNEKFKTVMSLGTGDRVQEGDEAVFTGFPLANELLQMGFGITMTTNTCIISSIKRRANDKTLHMFFVDVHANNGSSGSPIFDKKSGAVIGIVSGKIGQTIHLQNDKDNQQSKKFDIPANIAIGRPIDYAKKLIYSPVIN